MGRRIGGIVRPETVEEIESRQIAPGRIKAHVEAVAAQEGVEVPDQITLTVSTDALNPQKWAIRWEFDVPGD